MISIGADTEDAPLLPPVPLPLSLLPPPSSSSNPPPLPSRAQLVPRLVAALEGVPIVHVTAAGNTTLALSADGTVYGWGSNLDGQLGTGPQSGDQLLPGRVPLPGPAAAVALGSCHAAVLVREGRPPPQP